MGQTGAFASVEEMRAAAEGGDVAAQYNLGLAYVQGRGVSQSYEEAFAWWRKAAAQGHAGAQCDIGTLYRYGRLGAPDPEKLAYLDAEGLGVRRDDEKARRWFMKAAEQGQPSAQYALGRIYETGRGVEANNKAAVGWYALAAMQGYQAAIEAVARLAGPEDESKLH